MKPTRISLHLSCLHVTYLNGHGLHLSEIQVTLLNYLLWFPVKQSAEKLLQKNAASIFRFGSEKTLHQNVFYSCQTIRSHPGTLEMLRTSMAKRVYGTLFKVGDILNICYEL